MDINRPSAKWKNRRKSWIMKWLLYFAEKKDQDAAAVLGISRSYFDNKLHRNSFSFEDILILSELAHINIAFVDERSGIIIDQIDFDKWFEDKPEVTLNIEEYRKLERNKQYQLYLQKKAELEELEKTLDIN